MALAQEITSEKLPNLGDLQIKVNKGDKGDSDNSSTIKPSVELDSNDLKRIGQNRLSDLKESIPGFQAFGITPRVSGFSIRGVGNNQFNDGLESSVGLYADGIYLGRQSYGAFGLYDLENINVFKGPQGSDGGYGNLAGEVQINTAQATFKPSENVSSTIGNYGYIQNNVVLNGPLNSSVAGRLSLYRQSRNGLLFNQFDGSHLNNQNRFGLRGQLNIVSDSGTVVRLIAELDHLDEKCCSLTLLPPVSKTVSSSDAYMGYMRPGTNPYDRTTLNDVASRTVADRKSFTMTVESGTERGTRLISLTGVNFLDNRPAQNDDGTSLRLLTGQVTASSKQFSQEFRIVHSLKRLKTTAGVLLIHENLEGQEVGILGDQIAQWALGGLINQANPSLTLANTGAAFNLLIPPQTLNGMTVSTPYRQTSNRVSVYGSTELRLDPGNTLIAGLRTKATSSQAYIDRTRTGGNPNASPLAATNSLAGLGTLLGINLGGYTFNGFLDSLVGAPFSRSDHYSDRATRGNIAWQSQLNPNLIGVVGVASAYESGGINLSGLDANVPGTFAPANAVNLEAGLKGYWPEHRFNLQASIYTGKVKNYQAVTFGLNNALIQNPRQNKVLNIPRVNLQGIELAIGGQPSKNWAVRSGLAYNKAISTEFPNVPNEDTKQNDKNLSGQQLYNAPRWSGLAGVSYYQPIGLSKKLFVNLDHSLRSGTYASVEQSRSSYINAYQLTNLQVGVAHSSEKWSVSAWVHNLFNTQYLSAVAAQYGLGDYGGIAGDPRTYGVTLGLSLDH